MYFLGIDTSCYTTSVAIADAAGQILLDHRRLLSVPEGARGLRQSEMVFQHVKNLSDLFPQGYTDLKAVAASVAPRPAEGSYMPVFRVSESYAKAAAYTAGAAFYALSHQHAHIGAAMLGAGQVFVGDYLALHVSGGTTDLLSVRVRDNVIDRIETLGSCSDITAGQFIDRIGVALGHAFPAGEAISALAARGQAQPLRCTVRELSASFSGAESAVHRALEQGMSPEDAAATVLTCVAGVLDTLISRGRRQTGIDRVLLFGGVMRSEFVRRFLQARHRNLIFSEVKYASDNACGLAAQAAFRFAREQGEVDGGSAD